MAILYSDTPLEIIDGFIDEDNQYNYFVLEKIKNNHNLILKKFIIT